VYWLRQVFGIICGFVWGCIPMTGFVGHVVFMASNATLFYIYYAKYLAVDDEDMGRWDLMTEGMPTSYALFLVTWITVYTFRF